jgi:hypothetical protein
MKTLLLALISPGKSKGTREGAVRGLIGVGKEAVRKGLIEGSGAMIVGSECVFGETGPVVDAVMVGLLLHFIGQILTLINRTHLLCYSPDQRIQSH